jgi:hypothetical protein
MAMNYNQTLSNLRDAIADIQTALNDIGLDGSQSMAQWASQLETVSSTLQGLRDQISADDTDFENIYDAIVQKGQSPDEENRDTYAPAILAISGGGSGVLDTLSVTPSTQAQSITPPAGTDGYNRVNVSAVDASIDSDIVAGNIKNGVNILGVQGTYTGQAPSLQTKSVNPTTSQQVVEPDNGYDGLSAVTVGAVTSSIDSNIQAGNIKSGVNILGVNGTYTGGGSNYQQKTVTPSASQQVVSADSGYDALSQVTVNGSSNLVPANIKSGVEIFGVTGTAETGGITLNPHPTDLQYAGARASGHTDILPADGSWTTAVDLTAMTNTSGMRYLFYGNTVVEDIDLSGWTLPSGTSANYWFAGCTNLKHVRGSLSFANSSAFNGMFDQCSSLITCPITNFGFGLSTNTITLDLSASSVLDAHNMIQNMEINNSGKTRILKLHSTVHSGLSSADIALAASKNITLQ